MLLGRDTEQRVARPPARRRASGHQRRARLVGEAGIGKTALLDARRRARRATCACCVPAASSPRPTCPFAGLLELLRPALGALDRIPAPQAAALAAALALRPGERRRPLRGRRRDAEPARRAGGGRADARPRRRRALARRARPPRPCGSRCAGCWPTRSPSSSRCARASPRCSTAPTCRSLRLGGLDRAAPRARCWRRRRARRAVERLLRRHRRQPARAARAGRATPTTSRRAAGARRCRSPRRIAEALRCAASRVAARARRGERCCSPPPRPRRRPRDLLERAARRSARDRRARGRRGRRARDARRRRASSSATRSCAPPSTRGAEPPSAAPRTARSPRALPDRDADRRAWHLAAAARRARRRGVGGARAGGARARAGAARTPWPPPRFERAARLAAERRARGAAAATPPPRRPGSAARRRGRSTLLDEARDARPARRRSRSASSALRGQRRGSARAARSGARSSPTRPPSEAAGGDPQLAVDMLAEAVGAVLLRRRCRPDAAAAERAAALATTRTTGRRCASPRMRARHGAHRAAGRGEGARPRSARAVRTLERSRRLRDDPRLLAWAAIAPLWLREAERGRALMTRALEQPRDARASARSRCCSSTSPATRRRPTTGAARRSPTTRRSRLARETGQRAELARRARRARVAEARRAREASAGARRGGAARCCASSARGMLRAVVAGGARRARARARPARRRARAPRGVQRACSSELGIDDADLSPAPELVELHLRLGARRRADDALAGFAAEAAAQGAARGRSPGWRAPAGCSAADAGSTSASARRCACTPRRPTASRRRGRASPTARGCGARGAVTDAREHLARRWRRSSASAPRPGPTRPAPSCARRARPPAGALPCDARRADAAGAADRAAAGRRAHDARGGRGAVPQPEDRRVPPAHVYRKLGVNDREALAGALAHQ